MWWLWVWAHRRLAEVLVGTRMISGAPDEDDHKAQHRETSLTLSCKWASDEVSLKNRSEWCAIPSHECFPNIQLFWPHIDPMVKNTQTCQTHSIPFALLSELKPVSIISRRTKPRSSYDERYSERMHTGVCENTPCVYFQSFWVQSSFLPIISLTTTLTICMFQFDQGEKLDRRSFTQYPALSSNYSPSQEGEGKKLQISIIMYDLCTLRLKISKTQMLRRDRPTFVWQEHGILHNKKIQKQFWWQEKMCSKRCIKEEYNVAIIRLELD